MPMTVHTHRTTYERLDGDRVVESAEIEIRFNYQEHGGAPGYEPEVEIYQIEVLCAPGTRILTRRQAPYEIWSWAEVYFLDHAADLLAEAAAELNCRRIERDEHVVQWEQPLSRRNHNPTPFAPTQFAGA